MPQVEECAKKMGLKIEEVKDNDSKLRLEVPPLRADIMQACDIAEDIGIAYGYNNIPKVFPPTHTFGKQIPENKFTDLLRHELAQAGYIECLTMSLISVKESYDYLLKKPNMEEAVQISNPKTVEFEMVRTSLIPGLLKTLQSNASEALPQKIFEISDVVLLDESQDTKARNERRMAVMFLNTSSGFEIIHGILDLVMTKIGGRFGEEYKIEESDEPMYFQKRGAKVNFKGKVIGSMGVLHPEVLGNYHLKYPVSCFEIRMAELFEHFKESQS